MKRLIIILFILVFAASGQAFYYTGTTGSEKEPEKGGGKCPVTKIVGELADCKACHTLIQKKDKIVWGLKEIKPFTEFSPPMGAVFKIIDGETVGWYNFDYVEDAQVREVLEYFYRHKIEKIIFNVDSFGGSAFDGYAIANLFGEYVGKIKIITRVQSVAMSAGFLVFVAGHHRIVSPLATLMWHEIAYWTFLKKVTPSNSEQEALVMRLLQNMANTFLASKSNMTKEAIDAEIAYKDWFMSGKQALEMGFADELIK